MASTCEINGKEPIISYPCTWEYKLIALENININQISDNILKGKEYKIIFSNNSKNGKYKSYNLSTLVNNEDERKVIFEAFRQNVNIKYVL